MKNQKNTARTRAAIAAVALTLFLPHSAHALSYNFTGTLNPVGIVNPTGIWAGLSPGTAATLTVDFNFTGTDLAPSPETFQSTDSINSAQFILGSHTLNFSSGFVSIVNDLLGSIDQFSFTFDSASLTGVALGFDSLQFLIQDLTGTLFSSTALDQALVTIDGSSGILSLLGSGNMADGSFTVSAAVPETGNTGFLLAGALAAIAGLKTLHRRNPSAG